MEGPRGMVATTGSARRVVMTAEPPDLRDDRLESFSNRRQKARVFGRRRSMDSRPPPVAGRQTLRQRSCICSLGLLNTF